MNKNWFLSLLHFFTKVPPGPRSFGQIVKWWEIRRIFYNLVIIPYTILSAVLFFYLHDFLPTNPSTDDGSLLGILIFMVAGAIFYFIVINLAYCIGWISEGILNRLVKNNKLQGPKLMTLGYLLSFLLIAWPPISVVYRLCRKY